MAIFCIPINEARRLITLLGKDAFYEDALNFIVTTSVRGGAVLYYNYTTRVVTLLGISNQEDDSVYNLRTTEEYVELIFNTQLGT